MQDISVIQVIRPLEVRRLARLAGWRQVAIRWPGDGRRMERAVPDPALRAQALWSMGQGWVPVLRALVPASMAGMAAVAALTSRMPMADAACVSLLVAAYMGFLAFMLLPRARARMPFSSTPSTTGVPALDKMLEESCFVLASHAEACGLSAREVSRLGFLCEMLSGGIDDESTRALVEAEALAIAARMNTGAAAVQRALLDSSGTNGLLASLGHVGIPMRDDVGGRT